MSGTLERALVWFRRDLRVDDHAALSHALRAARAVWCAFVFDRNILGPLPRADRRVEFIRDSVAELDEALVKQGGGIVVLHGDPVDEIPRLARELGAAAVYANHDDEPYSRSRDARVRQILANDSIDFRTRKDHVVFERAELLTASGTPFGVFTPYKKAWLARAAPEDLAPHSVAERAAALAPPPADRCGVPTLADLGFAATNLREHTEPGARAANNLLQEFLQRIDRYADTRDFPALDGPSRLSVHLRFGTVSIRALARAAYERMQAGSRGAERWLAELIWRDFYAQVLFHHPHVVEQAFRREYEAVRWEQGAAADAAFEAWCAGCTGYPLVDAAMRALNQTGYMHNRLRMLTASFLTKDLGIDWRRGERYFAELLNDYDLASNNGNWQWAASTGTDPQPYFRIFNPVTQSEKFDAHGDFIRRYVPELAKLTAPTIHAPWRAAEAELAASGVRLGSHYPKPIVDHAEARKRALERYAAAVGRP